MSTSEWLVPKIWLIDVTQRNRVRHSLQGQFLGVQPLIFLVNCSMFPEFLISGGVIFQSLGPKHLKSFRPILTVIIDPVVKSMIKDCRVYFVIRIIHS